MRSRRTVSIVTPAYRAAAYVGEAIRSVLGQTYENWEMVVVDDGSPDETAEVVERFAKEDSRIRLVRQANGGAAAARRRALDEIEGQYVAFLDADDYWLPEKLEMQLGFMEEKKVAFSFTSFRRVAEDGSRVGRVIRAPKRLDYGKLLRNTAIATSTVMIDRAQVGSLRIRKTYYDDYALWLDVTRRGHVAWGLDVDLARYRVVGGSVSRNKIRSAYWVWRLYRDIEQLPVRRAASCFMFYAARAIVKYARF